MNFKPSSPKLDASKLPESRDAEDAEPIAAASADAPSANEPPPSDDAPAAEIPAAEMLLENAMRWDRFRLRRQRKRLSAEEYERRLGKSIETRRRRFDYEPQLDYPAELPITGYREEIVDLIRSRQTIVVCGETGSGKSTQLPKFCLEAGLGRDAMIGHTQPRRLAARSIASRLSEEIGCRLGEQVGYQVRFGDQTGPETLVKLMTDGVLLAETGSDRFLDQYEVIIIDEAHERSLNIDFLLAYLRRLQAKRSDLKIIITSATIDAERFAEHFSDADGPAPIFNVEGRGYPVEMRYLPWEEVTEDESRGYDLSQHVIAAIKNLSRSGSGDTLVFLPTERDIRLVSHRVAGHYKRMGLQDRVEVLPLYARLPQSDQQKIFRPTGQQQRLIFATNVAESSLTVPGIRYVIDSGTARMSRYSPRSKLQRLPIEPVSQASADQRAGRCGRVGPGICVRLYSEADYESRDEFTTPEIRRTNLAAVVLQAKMLGFENLDDLPLLDVPRPESIREGVQTLLELGALDDQNALTAIGKRLGRMPVDPRIGRILLAATEFGVLREVLPIAAAMEIPDPRVRPQDQQQAADEAHAEFVDPESDFLSLLRLWRFYEHAREEFSRNRVTKELRKRFLSPTRMREWSDTYRQLRDIATELPTDESRAKTKSRRKIGPPRYAEDFPRQTLDKEGYAAVHQALLSGFLSGVAMAGDKNVYVGPRDLKLYLWPGSGVFDAKPKWIVAAELVETSRQYARTVARIQPSWIERVGSHLLKASYSDPHWSDRAGGAFCYQRLSLFGLPIVVKRRVPLAPIDPVTARDLLIEQGLSEQKLRTNASFVRHNRQLREAIAQLAAKTRRRDLVVDHFSVLQFYQQRLPHDVCDKGRLEKFAKTVRKPEWVAHLRNASDVSRWLEQPPELEPDPACCFMRPADLIEVEAEGISEEDFPDQMRVGGSELPLEYRYEPGAEDDGVSVRVHRSAVTQISDDRLGWLVPGMLHAKIVAMIKSLPKRLRRQLVPAADVAKQVEAELMPNYGQVPFMKAMCDALSRHAETTIREGDFQRDKIDAHYQFLVRVVDDEGKTLGTDRSAEPLIRRFGGESPSGSTSHTEADDAFPTGRLQSFEIEELPVEVVRSRGGVRVAQYPALADRGDGVEIVLLPDRQAAEAVMKQGLTRLFAIAERKELRRQVRWLPELDQIKLKLSGSVPGETLESSLMDLLARIAFVENQPRVRSSADFETRRERRGERISAAVQEIAQWLQSLGDAYLKARSSIESLSRSNFSEVANDVEQQMNWLVHPEFLATTPWEWLIHYPRYFSAICYRLDKLSGGAVARDREAMETIGQLFRRWIERFNEGERTALKRGNDEFRWLLEELRVSLFAQPLGTSTKVSAKRLEKWLAKNQN
jgi:ATP-dependent helicase HrpA